MGFNNISTTINFIGTVDDMDDFNRVVHAGDACVHNGQVYLYAGNSWEKVESDNFYPTDINKSIIPRRFNCNHCGAVGQIDVCSFCGSVP